MRRLFFSSLALALLAGCGASAKSFVHTDTTLGRVVVYKSGVAYFERSAHVEGDTLRLSVPADKIDDFLKSLTVVDLKTGEPAPIAYPTTQPSSETGLVDMAIKLPGASPHDIRLTYVTEAPSWKPSYRVVLEPGGKVKVQAWAIVDNTSGEDWQKVKLGVGSSSAMSFRYDLRSVRVVTRETLQSEDQFALAPPTGGATYGQAQAQVNVTARRVLAELSDDKLRKEEKPMAAPPAQVATAQSEAPRKKGKGDMARERRGGEQSGFGGVGGAFDGRAAPSSTASDPMAGLFAALQQTKSPIVVEGFADEKDADKTAASLDRANRARDELVRRGISPDRVIALGRGEQAGQKAGVRIVEGPPPAQAKSGDAPKASEGTDPIGTSHFESDAPMTVPRGTSAMVSILHTEAEGDAVYLYDPESPRGNAAFPFRAIRIKNPTDSVLESGPVTVFGEGKFVGEGLAEPIPARSAAFVPFALDRQIVVEKKEAEHDEIARILTVQRGVLETEIRHSKRQVLVLHNRLPDKATVYVRHTVAQGYELVHAPPTAERVAEAHLFRVDVEPGGQSEITIEEATPVYRTTDVRTTNGLDLVKAYLASAPAESPLRRELAEVVKLRTEMANVEQEIATKREQMNELRARMDELHAQIVTLRAVRTQSSLVGHLEKKLDEVSDRVSKQTLEIVALEEKLMVARVRFQDAIAELTLEKPSASVETTGAMTGS